MTCPFFSQAKQSRLGLQGVIQQSGNAGNASGLPYRRDYHHQWILNIMRPCIQGVAHLLLNGLGFTRQQ